MKKRLHCAICVFLLGVWAAGPAAGQARLWDEPGPCDRACLSGTVDRYLEAVVAHDPDAAPLADDIRFTENTEVLRIGEGLWKDATAAPTTFKIYVPDPVARQVGFIGVMQTTEGPIQLALRLKVEDGVITEAEHIIARNLGENSLPNLVTPRPGLLATIPLNERIARELMLIIAASYYDALIQSSGDATLFADDCKRHENGMITAGGEGIGFGGLPRQGCYDQMNSRTFTYITGIDLQRVWIADPLTGLVFGMSHFRHEFATKEIQVIGRDGEVTTRVMDYNPFDFPAVHITKIQDYRIHDQEAMGFTMPYKSSNGWNRFVR